MQHTAMTDRRSYKSYRWKNWIVIDVKVVAPSLSLSFSLDRLLALVLFLDGTRFAEDTITPATMFALALFEQYLLYNHLRTALTNDGNSSG